MKLSLLLLLAVGAGMGWTEGDVLTFEMLAAVNIGVPLIFLIIWFVWERPKERADAAHRKP